MRALVLVACWSAIAGATEWNHLGSPAPAGWQRYADTAIAFAYPASAKVEVTKRGVTIALDGARLEISSEATNDPGGPGESSSRAGSGIDRVVFGPRRRARCRGEVTDVKAAEIARTICATLDLALPPRRPNVQVTAEATDIADSDSVMIKLAALEPELTRCWESQIARTPHITRGNLDYERRFANGTVTTSSHSRASFFDDKTHKAVDTEALGACVFPILDRVPVASAGAHGRIFIDAACLFY